MIKRGVYAAGLSVLNKDLSLNVDATIIHAESIINRGLSGVFFFGSTGQSQLIASREKKELISKLSTHKLKKNFFLGTGENSLSENIDLIKYAMEYNFQTFLIMPPAYYKGNTDEGIFNFYSQIIFRAPKIKIILYNFEKLSGYKFSGESVTKLTQAFPKNIVGCKDSGYNLFESLKLPNFLIFPGSEAKLLKGLELGCAGCISAVTNVTHSISRKVFDDFENKKEQTANEKLILVRETFDKYNLISGLHSFMSVEEKNFENLLPPLVLLSEEKKKELLSKLESLKFLPKKNLAA
ncbi:dihydrodipicolinate synthase family protein [Pelagibacteraceae bacterium]|nr:dihydrodipicolinate synthase family protein [Pelagibacteraceae bacterium]